MSGLSIARRALLSAAACGLSMSALADPSPVVSNGVPPQIVPSAAEIGVTLQQMPSGGTSSSGSSSGTPPSSSGGTPSSGSGAAYDNMMATSYGAAAAQDAQQAGINPNALADIGQAESGFRNIPTANGSSSATGPWQITTGTFNQFNQQYNLGYSASDITDPNAQAAVASYIIQNYANTVSQATGQPATVVQAYGAYVFGPSAGAQIASADSSTPLSSIVSSQALSNNNMQGWTVGQFQQVMSSRLGPTSNQPVQAST